MGRDIPVALDKTGVVLQAIRRVIVVPDGAISGLRQHPIAFFRISEPFDDSLESIGLLMRGFVLRQRHGHLPFDSI